MRAIFDVTDAYAWDPTTASHDDVFKSCRLENALYQDGVRFLNGVEISPQRLGPLCGGFLQLVAFGAGAWSLDARAMGSTFRQKN